MHFLLLNCFCPQPTQSLQWGLYCALAPKLVTIFIQMVCAATPIASLGLLAPVSFGIFHWLT